MAAWPQTWRADIALRGLGSGVLAIAGFAVSGLGAPSIPLDAPVLVALLAAIAFLCGSAGSAMLLLGAHLFDRIEVGARWQPSANSPLRQRDAS